MNSRTTANFRKLLRILPADVRRQARISYRLFHRDPTHPSLRFKRIHPTEPIYSARVGLNWRAVGARTADAIVWFWIGSHADYDQLIASYRRRPK